MTDQIREHITDIRQLAEEMALTAEGVPGMNLTLSKARIASVCRAFLAATAHSSESADTNAVEKGPATERPGVDSGALQSLTSAAKSSTTPSSAALRTCARCKVSWTAPVEACPECGPMRWVPVSDSIVIRHIQVINPALPIYARAESGQWFRLDGLLQLTVGEPE